MAMIRMNRQPVLISFCRVLASTWTSMYKKNMADDPGMFHKGAPPVQSLISDLATTKYESTLVLLG